MNRSRALLLEGRTSIDRGPPPGRPPGLRNESGSETLALYVHIPYCLRKCPYCDFSSVEVRKVPQARYLSALVTELRTYGKMERWAARRLASVYFGGGTPSLLAPETVEALLDAAEESLAACEEVEVTLEANPATLGEVDYRRLLRAGVNRLSLGIQSFDERVLSKLGRLHTAADNLECLRNASAAGFANIGVDLIFGVPGQSPAQWNADLDRCLELEPAHVSTYELTIEPGTPFHRMRQAGLLPAQSEDDLLEMYTTARNILTSNGYRHYEISNFARPGWEARHNATYWQRAPYLGIGAGAHSFDPAYGWGVRWSNWDDPPTYIETVSARGSACRQREELSKEQAMAEFVFLGLRQLCGIDPRQFETAFGEPLESSFPQAAPLVASGLLAMHKHNLVLTEQGLLLADSVLAKLLAN